MTTQQAIDFAKRRTVLEAAALVMTVTHVGARLRELTDIARGSDPWLADALAGLAAQLHAGLHARPEHEALERWAVGLESAEPRRGTGRIRLLAAERREGGVS